MTSETLAEALPREIKRVRDEVIPAYQEIGDPGALACHFLRRDLDEAVRAMASGDVVAMLCSYKALRGAE